MVMVMVLNSAYTGPLLVHNTWICIFRLLSKKLQKYSPKLNHVFVFEKTAAMDFSHRAHKRLPLVWS